MAECLWTRHIISLKTLVRLKFPKPSLSTQAFVIFKELLIYCLFLTATMLV